MPASLADLPPHLRALAAKIQERQERKQAFLRSGTFLRMRNALATAPGPVSVDTEDVKYYFHKTCQHVGWGFACEEDVRQFFDIIGDSEAATVEPGSLAEDPASSFGRFTFRHYGLHVAVLIGQGSIITVSNQPLA